MKTLHAFLLLAAAVAAQDLTPKADRRQPAIAIVNGTVHTVSGKTHSPGYVYFERGKLVHVAAGEAAFPGGVTIIDATGKHVYPGLFAPHTNLGLTEIGAVRAMRDYDEVGEITPEVRAAVAVNPDSTLLPVTRSNGVLTFATFPQGGALTGRASVMRMDGWTWEDMAIRADAGLVVTWPRAAAPPRGGFRGTRPFDDKARRLALQRIENAFDDAIAYHAARRADAKTPIDIRWDAMRSVIEGERPVFFLAHDQEEITGAVQFAIKRKLRPVIVGGTDAWIVAPLLKKHGVPVIVQSIHRFPKRSDSDFDETYALPARLEAAGLLWCLASGERSANVRNLPYAAGRAAAYGLDKAAALRAITLNPAKIFGVADHVGSLEKGKAATLIVTDGDPLEVTTRIERAFVDGRAIDLSNKQTKLYEKYRKKYKDLGLIK